MRIEDNEEITTTYLLNFELVDEQNSGFWFECDEHGNVDESAMKPLMLENYRKCVSGDLNVIRKGVSKFENRIRLCNCGSEKHTEDIYDGRNIFLCRVCDDCKAQRLSGYRSDIFESYESDEPLDD